MYDVGSNTAKILRDGLQVVIGSGNMADFWFDVRWDNKLTSLSKRLVHAFLLWLQTRAVVSKSMVIGWIQDRCGMCR